ncbi:unnamed protein product [Trichobilharzia regenti]|nr:unnamed protein product [Trichobilharzia regenti]
MNLDPGPCKASFPSYYYDSRLNQCKKFIYGGCGGNRNRFASKESCENACRCRAAIPSYYYDPSSNTCKVFTYGGCGGNGNRFPSKEACEKACNCGKPNNKQ